MLRLERPLAFIDTETTGVDVKTDRILQIGMVKINPDGREQEWESLVNPGIPIPPENTAIHGITNEMVENAHPFDVVGPIFAQGIQGCDVCGWNVRFDLRILWYEFKRINRTFSINKILDGLQIWRMMEPRNLTGAVKHFLEDDFPNAHNALVDARASKNVFIAQVSKYGLPSTVNKIFDMFDDGIDKDRKFIWKKGIATMNFGAHRDVPMDKVHAEYYDWMLKKGKFSNEVKAIVERAIQGEFPEEK